MSFRASCAEIRLSGSKVSIRSIKFFPSTEILLHSSAFSHEKINEKSMKKINEKSMKKINEKSMKKTMKNQSNS